MQRITSWYGEPQLVVCSRPIGLHYSGTGAWWWDV